MAEEGEPCGELVLVDDSILVLIKVLENLWKNLNLSGSFSYRSSCTVLGLA